jgi:TolB-like protein
MDGLIAEHGGRIANTAGDSVLAEFSSAVDAVQCAVAVQERLGQVAADAPEDRPLHFRIGIHLGDVATRGGDLLGDGVNIAARLEGLAEPGCVCLSETVHAFVRKALPLAYTDLGEQALKNIDEPVRAYAVKPALAPTILASVPKPLPLPEKPSIAVLPFTNLSDDPEQEYFADGVVEDIITALSRFKSLFVVARNSSFTYKGRAVDVKQVGKELGVRHLLAGSVRKSGDRLRIAGQLIDARTGAHLWADRFDGAIANVFELQDEMTDRVVGAINPAVEQAEIDTARRSEKSNPDAYDQYLRGMAQIYLFTREGNAAAMTFFGESDRTRPRVRDGTCHGWVEICSAKITWMVERLSGGSRPRPAVRRNSGCLGRDDAVVLARAGHTLSYMVGDLDRGRLFIDRAVSLNPNLAAAWYASGWLRIWLGDPEVALEHLARLVRLSPRDAMMPGIQGATAFALFFAGRVDEAAALAEEILRERPGC